MSTYKYRPLDRPRDVSRGCPLTRLILLAPGQSSESLSCTLVPISVHYELQYEALSYTWGKTIAEAPLCCDGASIAITDNLDAALRHLRLPIQSRALWIDALCIDQSDANERTYQLQNMRLIYKYASRVIVWLGGEEEGVQEAFSLASSITKETDEHLQSLSGEQFQTWIKETFSHNFDALQQLSIFFRRPYFRRIWCIQEVAAARSIVAMCGNLQVDFRDLMAVASYAEGHGFHCNNTAFTTTTPLFTWTWLWFSRFSAPRGEQDVELKRYSFPGKCGYCNSDRRIVFMDDSLGPLLELFERTRSFEATDPRDKIFTLLGISTEGIQPLFLPFLLHGIPGSRLQQLLLLPCYFATQVTISINRRWPEKQIGRPKELKADYNLGLADVCTNTALYLMRIRPGLLDVLSHVEHQEDPCRNSAPSWMPKWFEKPQTKWLGCNSWFSAGLWTGRTIGRYSTVQSIPSSKTESQPSRLQAKGFPSDTVAKVGSVMQFGVVDEIPLHALWNELFEEPFNPSAVRHGFGQTDETAFCKTIMVHGFDLGEKLGVRRYEVCPDGVRADILAASDAAVTKLLVEMGLKPADDNDEPSGFPEKLRELGSSDSTSVVKEYCHHRRLYLTQSGKLGLGPEVMQVGDEICVLFGGRMPFVLRPKHDYHVFIGDTYLNDHDLMWGITVDSIKRGNIKRAVKTFTLR